MKNERYKSTAVSLIIRKSECFFYDQCIPLGVIAVKINAHGAVLDEKDGMKSEKNTLQTGQNHLS